MTDAVALDQQRQQRPGRRGYRERWAMLWPAAVLLAFWLVVIAAVNPTGEFPLNDDWAHARSVQIFLETGQWVRLQWTWVLLLTNVLIGAAASWLGGFSFETLRWSSLLLGYAGMVGTYLLCREVGGSRGLALVSALVVGLNPIYLNLSFTFMTDVPFTALVVGSLWLLVRGMQRRSAACWVLGSLLAAAATLSRQVGLAVGLAWAGAWLLTGRGERSRAAAAWAVIAVAAVVGGAYAWAYAYAQHHNPHWLSLAGYVDQHLLKSAMPRRLAEHAWIAAGYIGCMLLPLAGVLAWSAGRRRHGGWIAGGVAGVGIGLCVVFNRWMPLGMNMIYDLGVGPEVEGHGITAPRWLWVVLTLAGFGVAGLLCAATTLPRGWRWRSWLNQHRCRLLLLLFVMVYLGVFLPRRPFFDRYLVPVLPAMLALVAATVGTRRLHGPMVVAWIGVLLMGSLSVLATHDYMARHRARWTLLHEVMAQGVSPQRIDGGFEFNGWFNYHPDASRFKSLKHRWVYDDEFILSYSPGEGGYEAVRSISYQRWLTPAVERVYLHRRIDAPPAREAESKSATSHAAAG